MKVKFFTLGCKVNQYETQALTELFLKNGYELCNDAEQADICIVNSCTVTAQSDHKSRQAVRHFKKENPDSCVILTGCMPQSYPDDAAALTEADIVLGNANNTDILNAVREFFMSHDRIIRIVKHRAGEDFDPAQISEFEGRTRAMMKIEDGCNRACSYCVIPRARGGVRSRPPALLAAEAKRLADAGFKELVLVGINLSSYGMNENYDLCDAVHTVALTDGIERIRLGSIEPDRMTPDIIERLAQEKKLCPHFHLSLQSGCDETLKRMNRFYTAAEYEEVCTLLRNSFADCSITTDIMVGFAGETDGEFENSLSFAKRIGFAKAHIFPYSRREGTRAAGFPDQLTNAVKSQRAKRMAEVTEKTRADFIRSQLGKSFSVIVEGKEHDGFFLGHTANYTPVRLDPDSFVIGETALVTLTENPEDENLPIGIRNTNS